MTTNRISQDEIDDKWSEMMDELGYYGDMQGRVESLFIWIAQKECPDYEFIIIEDDLPETGVENAVYFITAKPVEGSDIDYIYQCFLWEDDEYNLYIQMIVGETDETAHVAFKKRQ